ncbi:MAG: protein kinase [Planctomycetota bacterium]
MRDERQAAVSSRTRPEIGFRARSRVAVDGDPLAAGGAAPLAGTERQPPPDLHSDALLEIDAFAKACKRDGRLVDLTAIIKAVPAMRREMSLVDAAVEHAFASLEAHGRRPDQAQLELEIRFPEFAAAIATAGALRVMMSGEPRLRAAGTAGRSLCAEDDHEPRYRLVRMIGRGANGSVYEAVDSGGSVKREPRTVAIKIFNDAAPWWSAERGPFAEAERVARIPHPAIATVERCTASADREPFIVTEFATAGSLQGLLERRHAITATWLVTLGRDVCRAAHNAHQRGLVHGNIKPANIMMFGDPTDPARLVAKLCDFGSTGRLGLRAAESGVDTANTHDASTAPDRPLFDLSMSVEQLHAVRDTMLFAPPELRGGQSNPTTLSDVYSLGATVRYALNFADDRSSACDRRLAGILDRATSAAQGDRQASADELAQEFDAWLSRKPTAREGIPARIVLWSRRSPMTAAILATVLLSAGASAVLLAGSREAAAYDAGTEAVTDAMSEWLSANAISWDRTHPLRDWVSTTILFDRLRDDEYFRSLVGDRSAPEARAREVRGQLDLMARDGDREPTLGEALMSIELALHQVRSRERYPDTLDLADRAIAQLGPSLASDDPLRRIAAAIGHAVVVKRSVQEEGSVDASQLQAAYEGLLSVLADRTEDLTMPLADRDRRDPIVQLALRAVQHLSMPARFDDARVYRWAVAQNRNQPAAMEQPGSRRPATESFRVPSVSDN